MIPITICDLTGIESLCMPEGFLIPAPDKEIEKFDRNTQLYFMYKYGIYTLPTLEIVNFLGLLVNNPEECLEIGSGTGAIGRALGIRTTDSRLQERPDIIEKYGEMGQPVIVYPSHVEKIDANEAVRKYKPKTVFGSYITHRWNGTSGNPDGPDLMQIIKTPDTKLVLIGNDRVHHMNPIMKVTHSTFETPPYLITRSDQMFNWIKIWNH